MLHHNALHSISYGGTLSDMHSNRESWLLAACDSLAPTVASIVGRPSLTVRVACGWPSTKGLAARNRRIGECWPAGGADGIPQVFISPTLDDPPTVLATLVHELLHAALPPKTGHKAPFPKHAKALGLEGKPTATTAGAALTERLHALAAELGTYPHAALNASTKPKQGTRMLKLVCPDCGYTVRTTQKWIDEGVPTCHCGTEMSV